MHNVETRIIEYDILRIIAILAIILIHVSAPYVIINNPTSIQFIIGNILDSLSRIGVPFFILISGTFMLDEFKNVSISKLKNKIIKLFIILAIWSAFYALIYNFHSFMHAFLYGHYHLWYLYFVIGLYLITPILRLFVRKENIKYMYYIILLAIIFNLIPKTLDGLFSYNDSVSSFFNLFSLSCISTFVCYYIAGWLIKVDWGKICKYKKILIIALVLSLISIILFTQLRTKIDFKAYKYFYDNSNFLVFSYSISLFILLKMLFTKYQLLNT